VDLSFNPVLAFVWSLFAGLLMSMGAGGGGILAGIGHISVLGIGDPNMIKVVNQILEFSSRIFSVPAYYRQRRLVWPLAISFGVGAPIGAIVGSWVSKHYLADMRLYRPVFGILVVLVAGRVLYESWSKALRRNAQLKRARDLSDRVHREYRERIRNSSADKPAHPRMTRFGWRSTTIAFANEELVFNPLTSAAGGFGISFLGSMIGVGGGFLVTPFMASVLLFPMFLVVGTSLVALMIPLAASVATYLLLNVNIDWWLVAIEVPAIAIGSVAGPIINQYMNEKALRFFVAAVLVAIGIYYVLF